jgi:uncharacterized membrane-anchored protein
MTINIRPLRITRLACFALSLFALAPLARSAGKPEADGILKGPATAKLATHAEVKVPAGFFFLNGDQTRAMMRRHGEPVSGDELGYLSPQDDAWSVFFEFSDIGYIKDADKEKLDADKLLKQIKAGNEQGNEERVKNGVPPLEVIGWEQAPSYDPVTHNLEWCIRGRSEGHDILNYNTRLLGRKGVMEVVLVVEPEHLAATLPKFRDVVAGHQFVSGQSYAEYRPGDKIAKYGLGALVLGGAAVGAAKLGLFAWLAVFLKKAGKLVVVAVVAVAAFFKKMFNKLTGRGDSQS